MSEVSQREYFERRLDDFEKLVDERFDAVARNLVLQAEKDSRHFAALNHEQARLLADRERYLPRETYSADRKDKIAIWLALPSMIVSIVTLLATVLRWAP